MKLIRTVVINWNLRPKWESNLWKYLFGHDTLNLCLPSQCNVGMVKYMATFFQEFTYLGNVTHNKPTDNGQLYSTIFNICQNCYTELLFNLSRRLSHLQKCSGYKKPYSQFTQTRFWPQCHVDSFLSCLAKITCSFLFFSHSRELSSMWQVFKFWTLQDQKAHHKLYMKAMLQRKMLWCLSSQDKFLKNPISKWIWKELNFICRTILFMCNSILILCAISINFLSIWLWRLHLLFCYFT